MKYISWKKIAYLAAEYAYEDEVIDTGMYSLVIGCDEDFATKEEWIDARIQEWKDEFIEVKDK